MTRDGRMGHIMSRARQEQAQTGLRKPRERTWHMTHMSHDAEVGTLGTLGPQAHKYGMA